MLLKFQTRDVAGRKVKKLREQGLVPASIYGPSVKPQNVMVDAKEFRKLFKEAGYSNLFDLEGSDGKKAKALVKEIQLHPVSHEYFHVSFYQVDMNKKINAEIPVIISGESMAVKNNLGLLVVPFDSLIVSCLPGNLPKEILVDVSKFDSVGDSMSVKDITLPEGVTWGGDTVPEDVVAFIAEPQKSIEQEEAEEAAAAAAAAEAAGTAPEAGAEGAEGAAPAAEGAKPEAAPAKEEKK